MRYVRQEDYSRANRIAKFDAVGNISVTGSVRGMQELYGWPKGGQVRLGSYIYNVGPAAVEALNNANLLHG